MSIRVIPVDFSGFFSNYFSFGFYFTVVCHQWVFTLPWSATKKSEKIACKIDPPANCKKSWFWKMIFLCTHTSDMKCASHTDYLNTQIRNKKGKNKKQEKYGKNKCMHILILLTTGLWQ